MNQHEIPSSSPDVSKVKECQKSALDIADHVIKESSLVDSFQNKVNEVQMAREQIITLQSQLKISEETQRLMEAEFSFQKEEYEKEIEKLKKQQEELQNELVSKMNKQTTINVEALIAKEKEKFENQAKQMQIQIDELQSSLNIERSKSKSVSDNISEISNISSSLQAQITDKDKRISQLLADIQEKDRIINTQKEKLDEKEKSILEMQSRQPMSEDSVPLIVEKLRNRLSRANDKISDLQKIEVQNKKFAEVLTHYETQREILNDILQAEDENPRQDWTQLRNSALNAISLAKELPKVKKELSLAQEQINNLNILIKDYNSLKEQLINAKAKLSDLENVNERYNKLQVDNSVLQTTAKRNEQFSTMNSIRNLCAVALNMSQREISNSVSRLYNSITGEKDVNIRPIALTLFFITRWRRIAQHRSNDTGIDPMALVAFASSSGHSTILKIDKILEKYVNLTKEVVDIKIKLARSQEKRAAMRQIIVDQQTNAEQGYAKLKKEKIAINLLKERMKELQREMATLLPADKAEQLRTRITELEVENDKLNQENAEMDETINEQAAAIERMSAQLVDFEAAKNYSGKEVERLKEIAARREKEAEILDARLKEKTRDMLALERYAVQTENNPFKRGSDQAGTTFVPKVNAKFVPSS